MTTIPLPLAGMIECLACGLTVKSRNEWIVRVLANAVEEAK